MPFQFTNGDPDITAAIDNADPKFVTRKPRKNKPGKHQHIPIEEVKKEGLLLKQWFDDVHESHNELYEIPRKVECNVCIRPANDPDIVWRYEQRGPRQSARPYLTVPCVPEQTQFVRVAHDTYTTAVHPEMARSILEGQQGIPGCIISRWNHSRQKGLRTEANRLLTILKEGQNIAVYFES